MHIHEEELAKRVTAKLDRQDILSLLEGKYLKKDLEDAVVSIRVQGEDHELEMGIVNSVIIVKFVVSNYRAEEK